MTCLVPRDLVGSFAGVLIAMALGSCGPTDWVPDDVALAQCNDDKRNGNETDVDCGGSCKKCVIGSSCRGSSDCVSGECTGGICREPHCSNLVKDQDEEAIDCGGEDCRPCGGNDPCANGTQDEDETDVDCGDLSNCGPCGAGDRCESDNDCVSHSCEDQVCQDVVGGTGGGSNTGGTSGAGGQGAGGTGGAAVQAGAPNVGSGGTPNTTGSGGSSAAAPGSSGGVGVGTAGAVESGGSEDTGGHPNTGGAPVGEGGGAGMESTDGNSDGTGGSASGTDGTGGTGGNTGGTGGSSAGTGGSTAGTGGSTAGTGGSTAGTGGSTAGTGGTNACSHTAVPVDGLITNFSEITADTSWTSGSQTWGNADFSGGTFNYGTNYGSSGVTITATITSDHSLRLISSLPSGSFVGFGLAFDKCSDASDFTGISFTMSGSVGGGSAELQLQTSRNTPISATKGECEYTSESTKWSECAYNRTTITGLSSSSQVYDLDWSRFTGGAPIEPVDETELFGLQFQFACSTGSSCAIDVTIGDITFVAT